MKPLRLLLLLLLLLLLTACEDSYSGRLIVDGSHDVSSGASVDGVLLLLGGDITIEKGAAVAGSVYMLDGTLRLAGAVHGDLSLVGGQLLLAPGARVDGNLNVGGGDVQGSDDAVIGGALREGVGIQIPVELRSQNRAVGDVLLQSLIGGLLLALLAAAAVRFVPSLLGRVAGAATGHPIVAGALGTLVALVGPALLVILAFTVVLLPLALVGVLIAALIVIYGWISLGYALGHWLAPRFALQQRPATFTFAGTLILILFQGLLTLIPTAGPILSLVVVLVAAGAVLLTRFGTRTFVPSSAGIPSAVESAPPAETGQIYNS